MRRIFNWLPVILMTYVTTRECVVIFHQPNTHSNFRRTSTDGTDIRGSCCQIHYIPEQRSTLVQYFSICSSDFDGKMDQPHSNGNPGRKFWIWKRVYAVLASVYATTFLLWGISYEDIRRMSCMFLPFGWECPGDFRNGARV